MKNLIALKYYSSEHYLDPNDSRISLKKESEKILSTVIPFGGECEEENREIIYSVFWNKRKIGRLFRYSFWRGGVNSGWRSREDFFQMDQKVIERVYISDDQLPEEFLDETIEFYRFI